MLASISDTPANVEELLVQCGLIADDSKMKPKRRSFESIISASAKIVQHQPSMAASLLCTTAAVGIQFGLSSRRIKSLLATAARVHPARASWMIAELARWPRAEATHELAGRVETTGGEPYRAGPFSHGIVSKVDGSGSRQLLLFYRAAEGTLEALALLLNDTVGIKDVWANFDAGDVEEEARRHDLQIMYAPCDVALARELVADALALHVDTDRAVPGRFLLYRHYLGPEPLEPARRRAKLDAYMLESFVPTPALAKGSERLARESIFSDLAPKAPWAYEFLRPEVHKRRPLSDDVLVNFIREAERNDRDLLLSRMATNLELEALAGRAQKPLNRAAARTYVAIRERVMPFETVPYVREIYRDAAAGILMNLHMGFRSQEEANQAALDLEEALREGELQDEFWS